MPDRRPITFDGCFGWIHPGSRRRGVVLCAAFGLEGLAAHRAWGELAEALARAGLPTLRFDWPGTGDSLGDAGDPDRLAAWRAGLDAAIARLKRETGVDEIVLVGLRLGATLALEAAARRGDVAMVVAAAPVVTGAGWVREQRSLSRLLRVRAEADPPDADETGGFAVAGFFTADATAEDLKALDLRKFASPPAPRILLLLRDGDVAGVERAEAWRAAGATVDVAPFEGVDILLSDPTRALTPTAAWARIVDAATPSDPVGAPAAATPSNEIARLDQEAWSEQPLLFGPDDRLFGIVTTPRSPRDDVPMAILLDAGRNPHLGWGRGTVETARDLAAAGWRVLRMDQAGIGDSLAHPDGPAEVLYSQDSVADVVAAMDRSPSGAVDRFVLIGACSGGHLALHTALADPRVVGVAMVNLQRFLWRDGDSLEAAMRAEFRASTAYAGLIGRADTWRRLFSGEIRAGSIAVELVRRLGVRLVAKIRRLVTVDPAVRWLRTLDRRGVHILFVFGTDDGGRDEFAAHVGVEEALPSIVAGARLRLIERTDHNVGPRDARLALRAIVRDFIETCAGGR